MAEPDLIFSPPIPAHHSLADGGDLGAAGQAPEIALDLTVCPENGLSQTSPVGQRAIEELQDGILPRSGNVCLSRVGQLLWEAILLEPPPSNGGELQLPPRPSPDAGVLPSNEDRVLQLLRKLGTAAPREIAARLGWSRSTTQRVLTTLLESKQVERHGTTRSTSYPAGAIR